MNLHRDPITKQREHDAAFLAALRRTIPPHDDTKEATT